MAKGIKVLGILVAVMCCFLLQPEELEAQIPRSPQVPPIKSPAPPAVNNIPKQRETFIPRCGSYDPRRHEPLPGDVSKCIETCMSSDELNEDWRAYRHLCIEADKKGYSDEGCRQAIKRLEEKNTGVEDECVDLCCFLPAPDSFADRPHHARKTPVS